eukprot:COSAG06_NODE_46759_length_344_cov_0.979592_1_plen_37_part_10
MLLPDPAAAAAAAAGRRRRARPEGPSHQASSLETLVR